MKYLLLSLLFFSCQTRNKFQIPKQLLEKDKSCLEYEKSVLDFSFQTEDDERKIIGGEKKGIELLNNFNLNHYSTQESVSQLMYGLEENCTEEKLHKYTQWKLELKCYPQFREVFFFSSIFNSIKSEKWSQSTVNLAHAKVKAYIDYNLAHPSSNLALQGVLSTLKAISSTQELGKLSLLEKNFTDDFEALRTKFPQKDVDFNKCSGIEIIFAEVKLAKDYSQKLSKIRNSF